MSDDDWDYVDILEEERPRSAAHPPMSADKRAAQFAPFAALKGHDEAVTETARLTDRFTADETKADEIDGALRCMAERGRPTAVTLTWFEPDARKAGGRFVTRQALVKRVDVTAKALVFSDGTRLPTAALTAVKIDD